VRLRILGTPSTHLGLVRNLLWAGAGAGAGAGQMAWSARTAGDRRAGGQRPEGLPQHASIAPRVKTPTTTKQLIPTTTTSPLARTPVRPPCAHPPTAPLPTHPTAPILPLAPRPRRRPSACTPRQARCACPLTPRPPGSLTQTQSAPWAGCSTSSTAAARRRRRCGRCGLAGWIPPLPRCLALTAWPPSVRCGLRHSLPLVSSLAQYMLC
jgi:hypothetical protein